MKGSEEDGNFLKEKIEAQLSAKKGDDSDSSSESKQNSSEPPNPEAVPDPSIPSASDPEPVKIESDKPKRIILFGDMKS